MLHTIKRFLFTLGVLFALPLSAQAQVLSVEQADARVAEAQKAIDALSPQALASARRLLTLVRYNEFEDRLVPQMIEIVFQPILLGSSSINPANYDRIKEGLAQGLSQALKTVKPKIEVLQIASLTRAFNAAELEGLVAFYSTPLGQKMSAYAVESVSVDYVPIGTLAQNAAVQATPAIIDQLKKEGLLP
jgi:uncharacterized protein